MSSDDPPTDAQVVSKTVAPVPDIDNMKVPELRKRLKSMGLPISGNKAELIERLQEAYLGEKDGSLDGTLDDDSLEEALLNDDPDQSVIPETILGNEDYSFSSPEKESPKVSQVTALKPLKKRAIVSAPTTAIEAPKVPKTLVLKRNNYPSVDPIIPVTKKDHPLIEPPESKETPKVVKISTAADRLLIRAKRFNIIDVKEKSNSVKIPTEKKISAATEKVAVKPPTTLKSSNLDVLKKRAERFGENVSTVMKQLESQEKLLKRKLKFNDSTVQVNSSSKPLSTEQEQKKKRLERFGLVK